MPMTKRYVGNRTLHRVESVSLLSDGDTAYLSSRKAFSTIVLSICTVHTYAAMNERGFLRLRRQVQLLQEGTMRS